MLQGGMPQLAVPRRPGPSLGHRATPGPSWGSTV